MKQKNFKKYRSHHSLLRPEQISKLNEIKKKSGLPLNPIIRGLIDYALPDYKIKFDITLEGHINYLNKD